MSLAGEDRRTLLKRLSGVSVWGWCFSAAPPELLFGQQPKGLFLAKHQQAVQKGISWLASRVQEDGSFGQSAYQQNLAVVSLGGLAFLSRGHLPNRGPYGKYVSRLVDFVLQHAQQNGLISVPNEGVRGVMYGHGFASLFLAQVYGVTPQREVRSALNNAINLIVSTQNDEGGWRYGPTKKDADISVTVCQTMALRAARNAGFFVPGQTIARARAYVRNLQNDDGGFRYVTAVGESAYPRTGAAIVALASLGVKQNDIFAAASQYLMENIPADAEYAGDPHYFYGQYYAAHALWQLGGDNWSKWYDQVSELLLRKQLASGVWEDESICNEYATAMVCLILSMPKNFLPLLRK